MSATKELMDTLHRLLAEGLITEFKEAASTQLAPNAALAAVARAFLKDNDITVGMEDADDLAELRDELNNSASKRRRALADQAIFDLNSDTLN